MINKFVKKNQNPLIFRVFMLIIFIFMLFVLYFGSIKIIFNFTNTFIMFIIWTLWWPFLYISILFLGRFWCGFLCPAGLANEMGNNIRKSKKDYLMKYSFFPFLILFLIIFWEQVSGLFFSTNITFIFLITFILSAFLIGIILPRWGFCRNLCPIGTILNVFSRLSFFGLRTKKYLCNECKTKECIKGGKVDPCPLFKYVPNINSNKNCLLCTNCIKNCPHNSAKLCFTFPEKDIKLKTGFNLTESLFIISLLGLTILLTSKGISIGRFIIKNLNLNGIFLRLWDFFFWIAGSISLYYILNYLFARFNKLSKKDFKKYLIEGGYVFLPLSFFLMFSLIAFGFINPLTNIGEFWSSIIKYILLLIGGIWSMRFALILFKKKSFPYFFIILLIISFWSLILIQGPLNISSNSSEIYFAKNNEIVNIQANAMRFNPSIIKISPGDSIKLNLTIIDMTHAFDIDGLEIHMSSKQGGNLKIELRNVSKGIYEYYCAIPGHKEAGMKGVLIVE